MASNPRIIPAQAYELPSKVLADRFSAKGLLITSNKKILLLQKPSGKWDLPGGKLKGGEGWIDGLRREIYEESGLKIKQAEWLTGWPQGRATNKQILKGFFLCLLDNKANKYSIALSREHIGSKFCSLDRVGDHLPQEKYTVTLRYAARKLEN